MKGTDRVLAALAAKGVQPDVCRLVDRALARHAVVWAAAGHPHAVFATSHDELLTLTEGTPAVVGD